MIERVADRLRFETDRTVTVLSGKVELGQGLNDALTLICSEELALEPDRIRVRYGDTEATPDDGLTAGSGSMERAGAAVRDAARAARSELLRRASERLKVPVDRLEACSGAIRPRAAGAAAEPAPAPAPDLHEAATVEETSAARHRRLDAGSRLAHSLRRHRLLGYSRIRGVRCRTDRLAPPGRGGRDGRRGRRPG